MSFALFIESSHKKGMGHLFRMLNFAKFLNNKNEKFHLFTNNHDKSINWLQQNNLKFEIVNYNDLNSDWESDLIKKHKIIYWINDRLDTDFKHSQNVIKNNIKLITFDDEGNGAKLANLNICGMPCRHNVNKGKKILNAINYLILNPEIERYKRQRNSIKKILVNLGGSDTYGVTVEVAKHLKRLNKEATIIVGPSFEHNTELQKISEGFFDIKTTVPSLIQEFYHYDLAITGGGITPFEANASGLPSIILANEIHEILNAEFLAQMGSSVFAGYYKNADYGILEREFNIYKMSLNGLSNISTEAMSNIYKEIMQL